MKKTIIKLFVVFQLLSISMQWGDCFLAKIGDSAVELTEKESENEAEKETEKFEKEKKDIFFGYESLSENFINSVTLRYIEYSSLLTNASLEKADLPPEFIS